MTKLIKGKKYIGVNMEFQEFPAAKTEGIYLGIKDDVVAVLKGKQGHIFLVRRSTMERVKEEEHGTDN